MKTLLRFLVLVAGVSIVAGPLLAHHGRGATYDTKLVTLKVTITEVGWRNPHISFWADVKDSNGKVVNWGFEGPNVSTLTRQGITRNTLKVGQEINVTFLPARIGSAVGLVRGLSQLDGKRIFSQELNAIE